MVATWPSELPQRFDRQGFQAGMGDGRRRSKTDAGPGITRQGFSAVVDPIGGKMTMRGTARDILRAFIRDTLKGGSLPFLLPDPFAEEQIVGFELLVQFDEFPTWTNTAGDWWVAAFTLFSLPTGGFITGVPPLQIGGLYITFNGALVVSNGAAVFTAVAP